MTETDPDPEPNSNSNANTNSISIAPSSVRWLLVGVGVVSLCAALVVVFTPSIEGGRYWPWHDETLLVASFTVMFVIACLLAPFVLFDEPDRTEQVSQTEQTEQTERRPESVPPTPTPGHDLERVLDRRWPTVLLPARYQRTRAQLRQTVIRTIVRTTACSTEAAREQLERGTWTDDPVAAAFVRTRPETEQSLRRSLVERVRFPRDVRRTAQAIRTLGEETTEQRAWSRE